MKTTLRYLQITAFIFLLTAIPAIAQKGKLDITYNVSLSDPSSKMFHITTDIKNIDQPSLDLALPTWAPGWYVIKDYSKNVLRFKITDANGKWIQPRMTKKQTWRVDTKGIKQLRVDYDYEATVLGLNEAKITKDWAFFTGIEFFLEAVGHRNEQSTLKFQLPAGWKLMTPLKDTADPNTFIAADYDTLVDAPAMMGNIDIVPYTAEGKPHYLVSVPAGSFNAEKSKKFTEMLAGVVSSNSKLFGGLPYDKYISFYFFQPAESNASGALEHLNSFVAFAPAGVNSTPEQVIGTAAHEYFHLWNVKRIRPAEMWPYDYSRENETPLLWVSEGFTNYYGVVGTYRAGITSKQNFLERAADAAEGVESSEERNYIPPASASVSTWAGYDTPVAFGISYYTQGQNLAALLDLSIRNDTNGSKSLDDVMRTLYKDFYQKGRGFSTDDLLGVINRSSGKNYKDFFDKYVFGVDVPDYDKIYGYAGYKIDKKKSQVASLGIGLRYKNGGLTVTRVSPNTNAEAAGIKVDDTITAIDGTPIFQTNFSKLAGKDVVLKIMRDGQEISVPFKVGSREVTNYVLTELPAPTDRQLKIRSGWLAR